jgi:hypothetical protein
MGFNNNQRTLHGDNIAYEIQGADAYGVSGFLTAADVWHFLDQLESHLIETPKLAGRGPLEEVVTGWKRELERSFPDMET